MPLGRAAGNVRGSATRSNMDGGAGGAVAAMPMRGAAVRTPLWRPRPPRRPRRLRRRSGPVSEVCAAAEGAAARRRLFENGFLLALVHLLPGFVGLFFRKFRNDRLQSGHWLCSSFADGYARDCGRRHRNWRAQADQAFFRFLFPLWAAETLGGRGEPADGFLGRARLSQKAERARTPPWRRACVHTRRIAGPGDPRWFSLCGCVPEFVANRSLGGIVTAARTRGHRDSRKSYGRVLS